MIRWDRKGFAARTGFTGVKEGSALRAKIIDRPKKTLQRFSRLAGGCAVAVRCPALVWCLRNNMNELRSILLAEDNPDDVEPTLAGLTKLNLASAPFDKSAPFGPSSTNHRPKPCESQTEP